MWVGSTAFWIRTEAVQLGSEFAVYHGPSKMDLPPIFFTFFTASTCVILFVRKLLQSVLRGLAFLEFSIQPLVSERQSKTTQDKGLPQSAPLAPPSNRSAHIALSNSDFQFQMAKLSQTGRAQYACKCKAGNILCLIFCCRY